MALYQFHNALMLDVRVNRIELDEIWAYVGKKRGQVKESDPITIVIDGGAS